MLRKIWRSKTKRGVCYCLLYQSQQHGTCSASLFVHVNETTSLMFLYKIHLQIWNVILIPLKSLFFHWSFCFQDFSLWIFLQYYSDSKPTNCKLFSLVTAQVLNWTKANYEEKKKFQHICISGLTQGLRTALCMITEVITHLQKFNNKLRK